MQLSGLVHRFPGYVRMFLVFFVITLSAGYFSGFTFLERTTRLSASGIEKNYNGNENEENAEQFMFRKPEKEVLSIIHTHILSMSLIFFALGSILLITSVPEKLKYFLLIEPFISIIFTFGGIWMLWKQIAWFKYIVMVSGILLTASFVVIVGLLLWQLLFFKRS